MSKIKYRSSSPYFLTPQTSWFLGNFVNRPISPSIEDTPFVITSKFEYRPDLLSDKFYNTTDLWWVFSVRNKNIISDPIFDMKAGIEIQVPSLQNVQRLLGQREFL